MVRDFTSETETSNKMLLANEKRSTIITQITALHYLVYVLQGDIQNDAYCMDRGTASVSTVMLFRVLKIATRRINDLLWFITSHSFCMHVCVCSAVCRKKHFSSFHIWIWHTDDNEKILKNTQENFSKDSRGIWTC